MKKVKYINFDITANLKHAGKDFKGNQGLYDPRTDTIFIDSRLSAYRKRRTKHHEEAHRSLHLVKSDVGGNQEEVFCDLLEIVRTSNKWLAGLELWAKGLVTLGGALYWRRKGDREQIINLCLDYAGIRANANKRRELAEHWRGE